MKKLLYTTFILLSLISIGEKTLFSARKFYLSTEKTYTSSERARVKIESGHYVKNLQIRLYQVKNPLELYKKQKNFHRPVLSGNELRSNSVDVVKSFLNYTKKGVRNWVRSTFPYSNRKKSLNIVPALKGKFKSYHQRPSKIIEPLRNNNLKLLKNFNHKVPAFNKNWNYHYLFFNGLKPGIYLIEALNRNESAYTLLNISNIGIVVKKTPSHALFYVSDSRNGKPREDVNIMIYNRNKKLIKTVRKPDNGLAKVNLQSNEFFVYGKSSKNTYAFYDPRYYPISGSNTRVYMYTERPVYKGNDTVFFKGIMRKYENEKFVPVSTDEAIVFSVINSKGKIIHESELESENGSFNGQVKLPKDAPSGRYLLTAKINGKRHEAEFKVEYYKKPEFAVIIKPEQRIVVGGNRVSAELEAKYYFGAPVKGKLTYSVFRTKMPAKSFSTQDKNAFVSEAEFFFSRPELVHQGSAELDNQGKAQIEFDTTTQKEAYYYRIQARVRDRSGVPVSGSGRVRVVPALFRIQAAADKFVYSKGEEIKLTVKTLKYNGKGLSKRVNVVVATGKEDNKTIFIDKTVSTNENGEAILRFRAKESGFVRIYIEGRDNQDNQAIYEKFLWVGAHGAAYSYRGGLVKMVLDKPYYKVGETAKLLLLSPVSDIRFLFSLEGDKIYDYGIKRLNKNSAMIEIPVKENYAPNIFASISFIFNNQYYTNTIQLKVPPLEKVLNLSIQPEKEIYGPGEQGKVSVTVKDHQGNPVRNTEVSIAIVDEAIYGISPEIAVDITKFFYHFRRNNVLSWASIGYRFYGYARRVKEEMANHTFRHPNGLAGFKKSETRERKEFKDTILWLPAMKTNEEGKLEFKVPFPDNITKWRITAIAITGDTRIGKAKAFVITKNQFFGKLALPSVLNEKDEVTVYSTVHNTSSETVSARVKLQSENIQIMGRAKQVRLRPGNSQTLAWKIKPKEIGNAKLTLKITGKYPDTVTRHLRVIPHSIKKTKTINRRITPQNPGIIFDIPKKINSETLEIHLDVSMNYLNTIVNAVPYLIAYPHGCVEQTTSRFIPNMVASKTLRKIGIRLPSLEEKLPEMTQKGLQRLIQFQNKNGTWGWWRNDRINLFMTSYVLYALTLARENGYRVDAKVYQKGVNALIKNIGTAPNQTTRIFALYVLSLNKKSFPSMMERIMVSMLKNMDTGVLNSYDMALLTLTMKKYGLNREAKKILRVLKSRASLNSEKDSAFWGRNRSRNWFEDSVETTAWVIRAIHSVEPGSVLIDKAVNWMMANKRGARWKSTRDTAAAIFALSDLLDRKSLSKQHSYSVWLNNKKLKNVQFRRRKYLNRFQFNYNEIKDLLKSENNLLEIRTNKKSYVVHTSMALKYYTREAQIKSSYAGLRVSKSYYKLKAYPTGSGDKMKYRIGKRLSRVEKAKPILVKLEIMSKPSEYLMVEDIFPAGAIPIKDFELTLIDGIRKSKADFIDFRDGKVFFFASKMPGRMVFYYVLSPVYEGKFFSLPAMGSLMYFPNIRGNSAQKSLIITPEKN